MSTTATKNSEFLGIALISHKLTTAERERIAVSLGGEVDDLYEVTGIYYDPETEREMVWVKHKKRKGEARIPRQMLIRTQGEWGEGECW